MHRNVNDRHIYVGQARVFGDIERSPLPQELISPFSHPVSPHSGGPEELYADDGVLTSALSKALPKFGDDWWLLNRTNFQPIPIFSPTSEALTKQLIKT